MDPLAAPGPVPGQGRTAVGVAPLAVLGLLSLALRLAVLPASHEGNMSADAAHFLNVARCVARGEGFSNPAAWPAWLRPERLPAPETFKDPGYPHAIAAVTPLAGDPFRAGRLISLVAGVLLPPVVFLLGWRLTRDPSAAWVAALIAAASPAMIAQSVRVMAESLFTLLLTLAFLAAAPAPAGTLRAGAAPARRRLAPELAAGALLGLAFLVRTQALIALPALAALLAGGRPGRAGLARALRALAATAVVASPLLVRNLVRFGTPLYSDAATFAVWPFVDPIEFSHALTRPPAPLPFALEHAPQVLAHTASALWRFARSALPRDLLGHLAWAPLLAVGAALALRRWRTWGFAWLYLAPAALLMAAVSWNTRYFASTTPFWCLLAGLGASALAFRLPAAARRPATGLLAVAFLALAATQTLRAWREVRAGGPPELAAAIAEAPILAARLAPGEALMAVTTSYWSWFADRPSVHLVIAGEPAFSEVTRRYRVRWAALPTSRLPELAARFPGGRLPAALVADHADPERDITVFAVRDSAPDATPPAR
jgi:4-amino-4-deoxy-L-arabinose transferase-like glycosyltransferase